MSDEPPRWAEFVLSRLLAAGDRESIPGDLLEQYREEVRPSRGWLGSQIWYGKQVASLFWHLQPGAACGLLLGLVMSAAVVWLNVVSPLLPAAGPGRQAGESASEAVGWVGVLLLWAVPGFLAWRRGGKLLAALRAGALTALLSMGMVMLTFFLIDNLFLDIVSRQPEKIWGFQHSGYRSMRAFINHGLLRGLLTALPVMVAFGALMGTLGGFAAKLARRVRSGPPPPDGAGLERAGRG